jgi:hypothetical protein
MYTPPSETNMAEVDVFIVGRRAGGSEEEGRGLNSILAISTRNADGTITNPVGWDDFPMLEGFNMDDFHVRTVAYTAEIAALLHAAAQRGMPVWPAPRREINEDGDEIISIDTFGLPQRFTPLQTYAPGFYLRTYFESFSDDGEEIIPDALALMRLAFPWMKRDDAKYFTVGLRVPQLRNPGRMRFVGDVTIAAKENLAQDMRFISRIGAGQTTQNARDQYINLLKNAIRAENAHEMLNRRREERAERKALRQALEQVEALQTTPSPEEIRILEQQERDRKRAARDGVFAAYKLRDGAVPQSRFVNYAISEVETGKYHENCLINTLTDRYSRGRKIAAATICEWFADGQNTSPARLIEFCDQYHIPLRIYNGAGYEIASRQFSDTKRRGVAIVAENEHAYVCTAERVSDSAPRLQNNRDEDEKIRCELACKLLDSVQPNFTYFAEEEKRFGIKSLFYTRNGIPLDQQKDRVAADLNKAFYTALKMLSRPKNAWRVPMFTPHDDVSEFNAALEEDGGDKIIQNAYYFVSAAVYDSWENNTNGLLCARINNILSGPEAIYMIENGLLQRTDITHKKEAAHYTTTKRIWELFQETSKNLDEDQQKKQFAAWNGVLGMLWQEKAEKHIVVSKKADAELILATSAAELTHASGDGDFDEGFDVAPTEEAEEKNGRYCLQLRKGSRQFRQLNTRTAYDWIIAACNINCMKLHAAMQPHSGQLMRVKVDSATYQNAGQNWDDALAEFGSKIGVKRLPREKCYANEYGARIARDFINPVQLRELTKTEISEWVRLQETLVGGPGCGKSHEMKEIRRGSHKHAMAFTNMCAAQLASEDVPDPTTVHKGLQLFGAADIEEVAKSLHGPVWIDEISQLQPWIWSAIWVAGRYQKLYLSGDPDQAPPICIGVADAVQTDRLPWKTGLLLTRMLETATKLTHERRNSPKLQKLRKGIAAEQDPLKFVKKWIQNNPEMDGDAATDDEIYSRRVHIVFSNSLRRRVNAAVLQNLGLEHSSRIVPWDGCEDPAPLKRRDNTMSAFTTTVGVRLVAAVSCRAIGYKKGQFYEVVAATPETAEDASIITLREFDHNKPDSVDGAEIEMHHSHLAAFRVGFAITAMSCQGLTISEPMAVWQLNEMLRNEGDHRELAYTAVSRGKSCRDLYLSMSRKCTAEPLAETEAPADDERDNVAAWQQL